MKRVRKSKGDQRSFAYIADQRGTKAGDASASGVANAGIDNSSRTLIEQAMGELLGRTIAVGLQTFLTSGSIPCILGAQMVTAQIVAPKIVTAKIVELGAKIGQVLPVGDRLFFAPIYLAQSLAVVEGNFCLRGFEGKTGVPGTTIVEAKATASRARVSKRGINNVIVGHGKNQFVDRDSRKEIGLASQASVGGIVELEEMLHLRGWKSQTRQNTLALLVMTIGDEAVGIILRNVRSGGERVGTGATFGAHFFAPYSPPRRASSN